VAIKKGGFMRGKGEVLVISDGTGFSYGSYCLIGWYRGRVKKKVKAHCKVVFVLGEREGKRMILGVRVGSSYGDERKMFLSWLRGQREKIGERVKYVGDGLYGKSIEILREAKRRGWEIYVKVRERDMAGSEGGGEERGDERMGGREGDIQAEIQDRASDRVAKEVVW
jgi:hypothetical protein